MKKLIFSCLALVMMNSLYAAEEVVKNTEQKSPAKVEESGFNYKLLALRFAVPFDLKDENKNINKYLLGAALFGFLDDNINMIGLYADPYWRTAKNCSMTGISFATENTFKTVNGISTNIIAGINKQTNGITISGIMNKSEQTNGIAMSWLINVNEHMNGLACSFLGNLHKKMNGISIAVLGNGIYKKDAEKDTALFNTSELNGVAISCMVNGYKDANGIVIGVLGNKVDSMTGIACGFGNISDNMTGVACGLFNVLDNFTGYQLGGINVSKNSDMCLQAAFANVSRNANDTAQFGFWNIIRGEDDSDTMQFGFVNQSYTDSFQLGLLNFSEKGFFKFFPFINF